MRVLSTRERLLVKYRAHNPAETMEQIGKRCGYKNKQRVWLALQRPIVKHALAKELDKLDKKIDMAFDYKIKKLKNIIDKHADSDDATSARVAVAAIAESNKMQGHLSEQKIKLSLDEYRAGLDDKMRAAELKRYGSNS